MHDTYGTWLAAPESIVPMDHDPVIHCQSKPDLSMGRRNSRGREADQVGLRGVALLQKGSFGIAKFSTSREGGFHAR